MMMVIMNLLMMMMMMMIMTIYMFTMLIIFRYLNSHCNIDKNDSNCLFYTLLGVYNEQGHYKTAQRMLSEAKMLCCDVAKQCMISATIAEILDKTVWILSFYFHNFLVFS